MSFSEKSDGVWVPGWRSAKKQLQFTLPEEQRRSGVVAGGLLLSGKSYRTCSGNLLAKYIQRVLNFCHLILVTQSGLCCQESHLALLIKVL